MRQDHLQSMFCSSGKLEFRSTGILFLNCATSQVQVSIIILRCSLDFHCHKCLCSWLGKILSFESRALPRQFEWRVRYSHPQPPCDFQTCLPPSHFCLGLYPINSGLQVAIADTDGYQKDYQPWHRSGFHTGQLGDVQFPSSCVCVCEVEKKNDPSHVSLLSVNWFVGRISPYRLFIYADRSTPTIVVFLRAQSEFKVRQRDDIMASK